MPRATVCRIVVGLAGLLLAAFTVLADCYRG
jgi:hypothetical protein